MTQKSNYLKALKLAPPLLRDLVSAIPAEQLKAARIKNKWCIHSHACHIVDVQPMLIKRIEALINEPNPVFRPFVPEADEGEKNLLAQDLEDQLERFPALREKMVSLVEGASPEFWTNNASHPEYSAYTGAILTRHIMLHDQLHMYRIEELWLTNDGFLA